MLSGKRLTFLFGLCALLACFAATPAWAATYNVNSTADPPGAGCSGGTCSLRQALDAVNNGAGTGDTINLPAGRYIYLLGDLRADLPVTIVGAGARSTIIDANAASGVLYFQPGSSPSSLSGVSVTGGNNGGIRNEVNLTISDTVIAGNVDSGTAAGINNDNGATLTVDRSTISGNLAGTVGGGIYNQGIMNVTNSTISGNSANTSNSGWSAGGIYNSGTANITNTTITNNTADGGGGVEISSGSTVSFKNTIVAANTATGPGNANCDGSGTAASLGGNLEDANTCNFSQLADQRNTSPGLGPLQDNGGPTNTHALLAGSASIDRGTNSGCPATDQRGVPRPIGTCDIGAYEYAPPIVTTGGASGLNTAGGSLNGTILPNLRATNFYFEYGRTTTYGSATAVSDAGAGNSPVAAQAILKRLKSGKTYHYRLVASNAEGTTIGVDRTFKTSTFNGATLVSKTLRVDSSGRVRLRLRCARTTAGGKCRTVAGLSRKVGRLARGRLAITAGKTQTKLVRLTKAGRRLSNQSQSFTARLLLTSRDGSGNVKRRSYRVKVKR